MTKRQSLASAVKPLSIQERAQDAARVVEGMRAGATPTTRPAPSVARPARTVSYHIAADLAALVEDLAHARFMLRRGERDAALAAGEAWTGGDVRRSATQVVVEALDARVEDMRAELAEIEAKLRG
jgi:hypothetical protein